MCDSEESSGVQSGPFQPVVAVNMDVAAFRVAEDTVKCRQLIRRGDPWGNSPAAFGMLG